MNYDWSFFFSKFLNEFKINFRNTVINTMRCTDCRCYRINLGALYKFHRLFKVSTNGFITYNFFFHTGNNSDFSLNRNIPAMCIFCHLSCICDIFFKWQMRKVHHNAVPSSICAKLSKFFITAVIKM